tara:strand:+ start:425 stop:553 length:129 start_codon:yes stop_codon:yes gene_type:complete
MGAIEANDLVIQAGIACKKAKKEFGRGAVAVYEPGDENKYKG